MDAALGWVKNKIPWHGDDAILNLPDDLNDTPNWSLPDDLNDIPNPPNVLVRSQCLRLVAALQFSSASPTTSSRFLAFFIHLGVYIHCHYLWCSSVTLSLVFIIGIILVIPSEKFLPLSMKMIMINRLVMK